MGFIPIEAHHLRNNFFIWHRGHANPKSSSKPQENNPVAALSEMMDRDVFDWTCDGDGIVLVGVDGTRCFVAFSQDGGFEDV